MALCLLLLFRQGKYLCRNHTFMALFSGYGYTTSGLEKGRQMFFFIFIFYFEHKKEK